MAPLPGREVLVTIFGATGLQGSSVLEALIAARERGGPHYKIRAVTRNAQSEKARKLAARPGVEVFQADVRRDADVEGAVRGAYAVYAVTDFYTLGPIEFEVGQRMARAAKAAGVSHFVWSTLPNVEQQGRGRWKVPHFTDKAKVDEVVEKLGFEFYTFVEAAFYYQNFEKFGLAVTRPHGKVVFNLPMESHHMLTGFDVNDMGPGVACVLGNPEEWQGRRLCLAAYHAPVAQWIADFEHVTGRRAKLHTVVESVSEEWTQMFGWFREHTYYGNHDITLGRRANPALKTWPEWLRGAGWPA